MAINPHAAEIGLVCKTPSGLGGSFNVEILEVTATDALVKNTGNCEDFDDAPAYRRPFDQLTDITPAPKAAARIAAEVHNNQHTMSVIIFADQLAKYGYAADAERAELFDIENRRIAAKHTNNADYDRRYQIQTSLVAKLDSLKSSYRIKSTDYDALRHCL